MFYCLSLPRLPTKEGCLSAVRQHHLLFLFDLFSRSGRFGGINHRRWNLSRPGVQMWTPPAPPVLKLLRIHFTTLRSFLQAIEASPCCQRCSICYTLSRPKPPFSLDACQVLLSAKSMVSHAFRVAILGDLGRL